jgi:RNA polymerase sigma factor (sigma-70 family)
VKPRTKNAPFFGFCVSDQKLDFEASLDHVRRGDPVAVQEFVESFGPFILRAVRRKLDARLRKKFDSADFVQAVWASFFSKCLHKDRFSEVQDLVAFLSKLARNKVVDAFRCYLETEKSNIQRELSADDSTVGTMLRAPSEIAIARELWKRMLSRQPERHRQIIVMRFEGSTYPEIAKRLGLDESTARRVVSRLARDLKQ